jgi:hypothetical protein
MAANTKLKTVDHPPSLPSTSKSVRCGYLIYEIEKADDKWKCISCSLIIKEPIQLTECGHRCCKGCFESRAADAADDILTCQVDECNTKFHKSQVKLIFMSIKSCKDKLHIFLF